VFERSICGSPGPRDRRAAPDPCHVEMNPRDARELGLASDDAVEVRSRRGAVRVRVKVAEGIGRSQVFMPMHSAQTNRLTLAAFDPLSRQPSYEHAAVAVERTGRAEIETLENGRAS
jgi:anaerobic selenocysteine-containing dehydrogenase